MSAGLNILMFTSEGLSSSFFCRDVEKTCPSRKRLDEELLISCMSLHFFNCQIDIKVFFPVSTFMSPAKDQVLIGEVKVFSKKIIVVMLLTSLLQLFN